MYCMKCGKFIGTDDVYCSDCAPKEAPAAAPVVESTPVTEPIAEPVYTYYEPVKPQRQGRVMDGFGPALTSVILSIFAYAFAFVGYMYICICITGNEFFMELFAVPNDIITLACGIVVLAFAAGFAIPSLILGIKSIKCFRYAVSNKRVKPIPALALGIYGTYMSGSGLLLAVAAFMVLVSSLLMQF